MRFFRPSFSAASFCFSPSDLRQALNWAGLMSRLLEFETSDHAPRRSQGTIRASSVIINPCRLGATPLRTGRHRRAACTTLIVVGTLCVFDAFLAGGGEPAGG